MSNILPSTMLKHETIQSKLKLCLVLRCEYLYRLSNVMCGHPIPITAKLRITMWSHTEKTKIVTNSVKKFSDIISIINKTKLFNFIFVTINKKALSMNKWPKGLTFVHILGNSFFVNRQSCAFNYRKGCKQGYITFVSSGNTIRKLQITTLMLAVIANSKPNQFKCMIELTTHLFWSHDGHVNGIISFLLNFIS